MDPLNPCSEREVAKAHDMAAVFEAHGDLAMIISKLLFAGPLVISIVYYMEFSKTGTPEEVMKVSK